MKLLFAYVLIGCIGCLANSGAIADELAPTLGKKGKQLLLEKFDSAEVPTAWKKNTGAMKIQDGALRLSEVAADKHAGAFRKALPLQDMIVRFDFQLDGVKLFHLGFDPAPGELKKKGHLFNVAISDSKWSIVENNDKSNPDSKPKVLTQAKADFESNKWYTLTLENKGEDVVATIVPRGSTKGETLKAKAENFKVKKPALIFRAGGPDSAAVLIDNVEVYELD